MDCYGTYSKVKEQCPSCDKFPWCKDAGDHVSAHMPFENIEYAEEFGDNRTPLEQMYEKEKDKTDMLISAFSACLRIMIELKAKRPETFKYVWAKIENPSLSYSEIAQRFKTTKQNCDYHIHQGMKLFKELEHAVLIDQRFKSKKFDAR